MACKLSVADRCVKYKHLCFGMPSDKAECPDWSGCMRPIVLVRQLKPDIQKEVDYQDLRE